MGRLLRILAHLNRQAKIRAFGNMMSWWINLKYLVYDAILAIYGREPDISAESREFAKKLKDDGFVVIEDYVCSDLIDRMAERVHELLSDRSGYDASIAKLGIHRVRESSVQIDGLSDIPLFPKLKEILEAYYGSEYGIFSSDVYRTFPVSDDSPEKLDSLLWHFDNAPRDMVKVFVYLSDAMKDSGAVTVASRSVSSSLTRKGIYLRNDLEKHGARIQREAKLVEGAKGTIMLFTPQLNAHKATLPITGYRDAAVFLIHPAFKSRPATTEAQKREISTNFGYMVDPFSWRPLRTGDQ